MKKRNTIKIAPSILTADFSGLKSEIRRICVGSDMIHLDIADGNFVPNISFGPALVASIRPLTRLPFDVHLMVSDPGRFVEPFIQAGADIVTFHLEACRTPGKVIDRILRSGRKAGISLNPSTPLRKVFPYLSRLDLLLIMSVNPGFGGQRFLSSALSKIREAKRASSARGLDIQIEVDGGINLSTAKKAASAGADIIVAGSYIFQSSDPLRALMKLRKAVSVRED